MKVWQCTVCKYIHKGEEPPEKCPVCGVPASKFVEIDEASIPEKKPRRRKPAAEAATVSDPVPPKREGPPAPEPVNLSLKDKAESLLVTHHAHPVSVHTPNGVLPMAVVLYILAWLFDAPMLAKAAMISQVFVILSLPFVIFTGTLEWRKKYNAAMTPIFKLKIVAAALTSATCIITLVWFLVDPAILSSSKAWVFILINVMMLIFAGTAGHIGGKLVFKD